MSRKLLAATASIALIAVLSILSIPQSPQTEQLGSLKDLVFTPEAFALAAVDMYIKIPDIPGESSDKDHKDEIDILSWSWGMKREPQTGGGDKLNFDDLSLTKHVGKSTPKLMLACAEGKHLDEAQLIITRPTGQEYLIITMKKVLVTSVHTGGSAGDPLPTEQISLNFAKVEVTYIEKDPSGKSTEEHIFSWDIEGGVRG